MLGSVYRSKVEVEAIIVEDRLTVARTYKKRRRNVGGLGAGGSALQRAFEPPKWVTEPVTFKTDEDTWAEIDEGESVVKTGDRVRELIDVKSAGSEAA